MTTGPESKAAAKASYWIGKAMEYDNQLKKWRRKLRHAQKMWWKWSDIRDQERELKCK
jgi:hypothetical protein